MPTADLVQRWLRAERDPELEPEQHLGLDALVKKLAEFAEEEELKLDGPIVAEDVECCLQSEYDRRALGAWRAQRTDHGELAPSQCSDPRRLAAGCLVRKFKMAGRDKDGAAVVRHLWRRSPRAVGASTAESDDVRALRKFVFGKIDEAGASAEVQAEKALLSPPAKRFHWKAGLVIDVVHAFANISSAAPPSSVRRTSSQAALARASPLSLACVRPAGPRPGRLGRGEPGFAPRAAARLHCCRGAVAAAD